METQQNTWTWTARDKITSISCPPPPNIYILWTPTVNSSRCVFLTVIPKMTIAWCQLENLMHAEIPPLSIHPEEMQYTTPLNTLHHEFFVFFSSRASRLWKVHCWVYQCWRLVVLLCWGDWLFLLLHVPGEVICHRKLPLSLFIQEIARFRHRRLEWEISSTGNDTKNSQTENRWLSAPSQWLGVFVSAWNYSSKYLLTQIKWTSFLVFLVSYMVSAL